MFLKYIENEEKIDEEPVIEGYYIDKERNIHKILDKEVIILGEMMFGEIFIDKIKEQYT